MRFFLLILVTSLLIFSGCSNNSNNNSSNITKDNQDSNNTQGGNSTSSNIDKESNTTKTSTNNIDSNSSNQANSTPTEDILHIKGEVPGTLIEAFCKDGYYYTHSINNNTPKHPFDLEVPKGAICALTMTMYENSPTKKIVIPIAFKSSNRYVATFKIESDINLGYINLPKDKKSIEDNNSDGILDTPMIIESNSSSLKFIHNTISLIDSDGDGIVNKYDKEQNSNSKSDNNTTKDTNSTKSLKVLNTPKEIAKLYSYYHYKPIIKDAQNTLSFSIKNKPPFLEFNTTTAELIGIIDKVGEYKDITIDIKDKNYTKSITFNLKVLDKENLSLNYAKATQPPKDGYYYYKSPNLAIDGNKSTYNHTQGDINLNWLELEYPKNTKIKELAVYNRSGGTAYRLNGAKIYICQNSIESNISNLNRCKDVYTLSASTDAQLWENNSSYEGNFIVIKAKDNNNLHLAEVEVYGTLPNKPVIKSYQEYNLITYKDAKKGSYLTKIEAIDYQEDKLEYSLDNSKFSIDSNGKIYANEDLATGVYKIEVKVSDGKDSITKTIIIEVNSSDALAKLIKSGNIFTDRVNSSEILDEILNRLNQLKSKNELLELIYADNKIEYKPTKSSQYFKSYGSLEDIKPLIISNKGDILAVINSKFKSKFISFASNPINEFKNQNSSFEENFKSIIKYLLDGKKDINIYPVNNTIKDWLNENFDNLDISQGSLDKNSSLVIISKYYSIPMDKEVFKSKIQNLLNSGNSILYLHDSWGSNFYSDYIASINDSTFPYAGMWWRDTTTSWNNYKLMYSSFLDSYIKLFSHLKDEDFNFDWSKCKDKNGVYSKDSENCKEVEGLDEEFLRAAKRVKSIFNGLDEKRVDIFKSSNFTLEKLYILLADKYRQEIKYPMDKVRSNQNDYFKSLYSDYAVYNFREIAPKQLDMGNFSRSDFSHITPTSKVVKLVSKKPFRSTGVYALPGESFKVTRRDSSNCIVKVFVNSLRSEATHEYQKDGYKRPKFLQSAHIEIKPNETIKITSTYGGPIEVEFDKNEQNITLEFENIGEHPYWSSKEDNQKFADALDANEYDWAEISTQSFEVHSKIEKMKTTISNMTKPDLVEKGEWTYIIDKSSATGADLAYAIKRYTANYPFSLAGFKGEGIEVIDEANSFAVEHNITIDIVDFVKHMNADQASCGYGCSGNPYDAYWAFDPLGHGDIHEIGHGLEKSRFRFSGWEVHSTTNPYPFYSKAMYYKNTNHNPNCKSLPFKRVFDAIKDNNMTEFWSSSNWADQFMFTLQAMMSVQDMQKLNSGWHLLTRLHMLEREFNRAIKDENSWSSKKDNLGFSTYSYDEIKSISNNDWMLIALSFSSSADFRDYLDMWGLSYSQKASSQVDSFNFDKVAKKYFVPQEDNGYCKTNNSGGILYDSVVDMSDSNATYPY